MESSIPVRWLGTLNTIVILILTRQSMCRRYRRARIGHRSNTMGMLPIGNPIFLYSGTGEGT